MVVVALLTLLHWQCGFFVGYEPSFAPANVVLNLLMIKSDINGVMWSMTVECAATPLILLSAGLFRRHGEKPLWLLIGFLAALSSWGPYVHLLGGFTNLAPLYAFVVGVLIQLRGSLAPPLGRRPLASAMIAIATFCFCGMRTQSALVLLLECMSAATVVALIAYRPAMTLFKPLDSKLARFYGRISYSFYLLHPLGIAVVFRALDPQALGDLGLPISLTVICATAAAVLITTPAAYLSWRLIEAPAISFGKSVYHAAQTATGQRYGKRAPQSGR
jgi:peptidoglycan/LPS O-acetylase OafA/YrhL